MRDGGMKKCDHNGKRYDIDSEITIKIMIGKNSQKLRTREGSSTSVDFMHYKKVNCGGIDGIKISQIQINTFHYVLNLDIILRGYNLIALSLSRYNLYVVILYYYMSKFSIEIIYFFLKHRSYNREQIQISPGKLLYLRNI